MGTQLVRAPGFRWAEILSTASLASQRTVKDPQFHIRDLLFHSSPALFTAAPVAYESSWTRG